MALPLKPGTIFGLLRELKRGAGDDRPLGVSGALAEQLARELGADAAPGAVRVGVAPTRAAALVHVLAGPATEDDERQLRAADRARVPVVAVQTDPAAVGEVPYVLATDVVPCPPGRGFPVDEILTAVARRLGEDGTALAARLPALRRPLADELIRTFGRRNAVIAAAVFVPGVDFPVLTINQLRMVLRIAAAYGHEVDAKRAPEILGVIGAGLGFRALAHRALGAIPFGGWAVQAAVAYTGTRAIGEAAVQYFERLTQTAQSA